MPEQDTCRITFSVRSSELATLDSYCAENDLNRSQAIRRGIRLVTGQGAQPKSPAPRPKRAVA